MTNIEIYTYKPPDMEITYYYDNDTELRVFNATTTSFDDFCQQQYNCELTLEHIDPSRQDISQTIITTGPDTWFNALGNTMQHQVLSHFIQFSQNQSTGNYQFIQPKK